MVRLVNQSYEYTEPPLYQKIMPVYYQNYYHTINNLHTQLLLQQQHQPPPPLEQQPQQHQPQQQHHLLLQSPLTTSVNVTTTPPPQQSLLPLPNTVMPSAILNTNHLYANNYHMNHQLHKNFVSDTNFNNYKKLNGGSGGGGGGGVICSPAAATSAVAMVQPQLATKNSIFINGNSGVGCSSDGAIYSSSSSSSSSNSSCCQVSDNSSNGGSVVGATTTMTIATINVGESGGGGSVSDDEKICNNNDSNLNIVTTKNNCITSSSTFSSPTTTTTICSMATSFLPPCNKRGSDELLSQAAIMAPASDNNNQDLASKKVKLETNSTVLGGVGKPSRVIHIRNIPNESSETEVIQLGVSFGRVTNVLVLKGKNQAFLEMADEVSAAAIVACFNSNPPQVRGRTVYVQFSNHRELKTDQSHSVAQPLVLGLNSFLSKNHGGNNINNTTVALLNQDYQVTSPSSGSPLPISGTDPISHSVQNNHPGSPNTVLRVIVESLIYPVSLDILHQIFQRFGKVLKIVTFTKNNSFQALIQYPDAQTAQHAKAVLDGQNIYNGCCTLRIDNSKLTALNVKYNNDKSRDFTNPTLPPGEPGSEIIASAGGLMNANDLLLIAARQRPTITGDRLVNGLGTPGVLPPFALGLGTSLGGAYGGGIPSLGAFALTTTANLGATNPAALRGFSNVLLISNLNEEMVTPDALFTLFGVYGDVQRVKILYNKKDSALIQMAEPHQAYLAMTHLDKLRLWGKSIRVMASKHQAVQLPKEGQPDAGLTRDYAQNPLHRFKKPGSKNYQNIYPPSATLHLSNIPATVTEEEIREAFTNDEFDVKAFKFFPKDRKMALLQLSSVEEAVLALIKMHNHQLSESNHLRVSFSKSNI